MTITSQEFKQANARAKTLKASTPAATSARFDRKSGNIIVTLSSGVGIFFSPKDAQGLEDGTPAQLSQIEITPSGFGLHFPKARRRSLPPGNPRRLPRLTQVDGLPPRSSRWLLQKQTQSSSRPRQRLPRRTPPKARYIALIDPHLCNDRTAGGPPLVLLIQPITNDRVPHPSRTLRRVGV